MLREKNRLERIPRIDNRPKLFFVCFVVTCLMCIPLMLCPAWWWLLGLLPAAYMAWLMYGERRYSAGIDRLEWIMMFWDAPAWLKLKGVGLYGPTDGLLSAIECHESHIPGDCPLCGAK